VLERQRIERENRQLRAQVRDRVAPEHLIGDSPPMQRVFDAIDQVARMGVRVLITGESGTGKELVATAIHHRSPRARGPLIKLHCAALSEQELEGELFGRTRARNNGKLQLAEGGTLILDEVAELPSGIQMRLVRLLQEHERDLDVRLIAITRHDLSAEVAAGRFRQELFDRLRGATIELPPLRDRVSDIPALANYFLARYARENNKPIESLSPEALELLASYDWPGNVRELENAIEHAGVLVHGPHIDVRHLPPNVRPRRHMAGRPVIPGATMAELERYAILETLRVMGGSTSKAADVLGISVRTIQYRLHDYYDSPRGDVEALSAATGTPRRRTPEAR
jgi:DNA-binding NtrC family response regulator